MVDDAKRGSASWCSASINGNAKGSKYGIGIQLGFDSGFATTGAN